MKRMIRFIFILATGLLALAACAPAATSPAQPASRSGPNVVGYDGGLFPAQDLALIARTGRPQFIHSYADW